MSESTRRGFLAVAGAGAAVGVAAVAAPSAGAATPASAPRLPAGAAGAMAAYIKDVRKGEVLVMTGDHEVVVTDKELVARLAHAFATAAAESA